MRTWIIDANTKSNLPQPRLASDEIDGALTEFLHANGVKTVGICHIELRDRSFVMTLPLTDSGLPHKAFHASERFATDLLGMTFDPNRRTEHVDRPVYYPHLAA